MDSDEILSEIFTANSKAPTEMKQVSSHNFGRCDDDVVVGNGGDNADVAESAAALAKGSHLQVFIPPIRFRHGILVSDSEVIYYNSTLTLVGEADEKEFGITISDLATFSEEHEVQVVEYPLGCFDPEHTVRLAWSKLITNEASEASLFVNNSEQFAIWAKTGMISTDLQETVKTTALAAGVGGVLGGAIAAPLAVTVTETALPAWFAAYGTTTYTTIAVSGASIIGGVGIGAALLAGAYLGTKYLKKKFEDDENDEENKKDASLNGNNNDDDDDDGEDGNDNDKWKKKKKKNKVSGEEESSDDESGDFFDTADEDKASRMALPLLPAPRSPDSEASSRYEFPDHHLTTEPPRLSINGDDDLCPKAEEGKDHDNDVDDSIHRVHQHHQHLHDLPPEDESEIAVGKYSLSIWAASTQNEQNGTSEVPQTLCTELSRLSQLKVLLLRISMRIWLLDNQQEEFLCQTAVEYYSHRSSCYLPVLSLSELPKICSVRICPLNQPTLCRLRSNWRAASIVDDDNNLCIICYDRPRTHVFSPCGHLITCGECSKKIIPREGTDRCVVCDQRVEKVIMIQKI